MCQSELTEFFAELTEFAAELSEFSLPKQHSRNSIPPVSYFLLARKTTKKTRIFLPKRTPKSPLEKKRKTLQKPGNYLQTKEARKSNQVPIATLPRLCLPPPFPSHRGRPRQTLLGFSRDFGHGGPGRLCSSRRGFLQGRSQNKLGGRFGYSLFHFSPSLKTVTSFNKSLDSLNSILPQRR